MKSTSISTQLKLGFLLVVALFLLLIGLAAWRAHEVSAANRRMERSVELLVLAERWQAAVKQNSARSLAVAYADDGAMLEFFKGPMAATTRETTEIQNGFLQQLADDGSRARADDVMAVRKAWLAARDQINALRAAGDKDGARALVQGRFVPVSDDYIKVTQALVDGERAHIAAAQAEVDALFRQLYVAGAALSALAIACTLYISRRLGRRIREGIDTVLAHALQIGRGDLTQRIDTAGSDEIAQLMKALAAMQASLIRIVGEVHGGAHAIAQASEEISSGNSYLSSRTDAQAGSLQKTSASMNALAQAVQTNVDNARQTGQIVADATEVAQQGGAVMADVVQTMSAIQQSSEKIVDIIGVINSIAFQTNILALNAAVEAARAGEQGRGFAVVASEVRSLAQSSAGAAKQIKELIDNSVAGIADGNRLVAAAGSTMNKVVTSIRHVQSIMGEVDQATRRQGESIAEINQAIVEMDDMTRQNAALVGQAGAASDSLRQQIAALTGAVGNFKTAPGNAHTANPPPMLALP